MQTRLIAERMLILKKYFVLYVCCYFCFQALDLVIWKIASLPFFDKALAFYSRFWRWITPWFAKNVLHLKAAVAYSATGSGDTTYDYVVELLCLILAALLALVVLVPGKKISQKKLCSWTHIAVRYFLAYYLFSYGFVKVIKLQFPYPGLTRLTERYGDSSPMGLAWTFLGYSGAYNYFMGFAEVLAGVFLLWRRTTLLGAIVTIGVMLNVVVMNYTFDIPVKIFSTNLLIMAIFLTAFDFQRLVNFFILNKAVTPPPANYQMAGKRKIVFRRLMKGLVIFTVLYFTLWSSYQKRGKYMDFQQRPPLYGIYNVERYFKGNAEVPLFFTDTAHWRQVIFNYPGYVNLRSVSDSTVPLKLALDTVKKTMTFLSRTDSTTMYNLRYNMPDKEHLHLYGYSVVDHDSIQVWLKRFNEKNFRLMKTGFRWINEFPYNR